MLLRSLSSPIMSSWSEPEPIPVPAPELKKNKSFSLYPTRDPLSPKKIPGLKPPNPIRRRHSATIDRPWAEPAAAEEREIGLQTAVVGGGVGGGGGRICGGGRGGGRGSDGGDGSGLGDGYDSTESYYQRMIEADPNNGLVLGNYAKFLKEFRGDLPKAEEYCGRAILANPNDGNALSMYGDLIWQTKKDSNRAESYFDQAVKTDPEDSYVLASYARFLWDAEEEEENEKEGNYENCVTATPPKLVQGASRHSPLTTAS